MSANANANANANGIARLELAAKASHVGRVEAREERGRDRAGT
jgi:hypothetical protein